MIKAGVATAIDERHAAERNGRHKTRLLAAKLSALGEHSSAELAEICGIASSDLFRWLSAVREVELDGLLNLD